MEDAVGGGGLGLCRERLLAIYTRAREGRGREARAPPSGLRAHVAEQGLNLRCVPGSGWGRGNAPSAA